MKTISLKPTLLLKILIPVGWIALAGGGTLFVWMGWANQPTGSPLVELQWATLGIFLVGTPTAIWFCSLLKRVEMDANRLYVSNFSRRIEVPFEMITDVKENVAVTNIHPITVYFRESTQFGRKIMFLTPFHLSRWSSHPIADEIRALARPASRS